MKGTQCGTDADCLKCQYAEKGECPIYEEYGRLLLVNHVITDKLVKAGKAMGEMATQKRNAEKELASARRELDNLKAKLPAA